MVFNRTIWTFLIYIFISTFVHTFDNDEILNFNFDYNNLAAYHNLLDESHKINTQSSNCRVDFGEMNVTKSFSIINWVQVSWSIYKENKEHVMWLQCEAETLGWLSIGFTTDPSTVNGAEALLAWVDRITETSNITRILLHDDRLLFNVTEQGFKYWDEEVCLSSEGRIILKFKRYLNDGKHPLKPYNDFKPYFIITIGDNSNQRSSIIQQSSLSTYIWPDGPLSPEGFTGRWIFHYIMVSLYILGWFVR